MTSVQNNVNIIEHSDISLTMSYNRYVLSKTEIQNLLDELDNK